MDAGFLNFHKEEDFTSYFLDPCADDSHSYDGVAGDGPNKYDWDWDNEQELNGDIGLIPVSNQTADFCPLSSSPPSNEEFSKMMTDWHQLVNLDVTSDLAVDIDITPISPDVLMAPNGFDIAKYVEKPDPPKVHVGGKRIDMARRMYVVESDEESESEDDMEEEGEKDVNVVDDDDEDAPIDVETVTEHVSHPVLQAGDLDTLLEQFEATENTNMELQKTAVQNVCEIIPEEAILNSVTANDGQSEESDVEGVKYISPNKLKLISPIKSPIKRPSTVNTTPKKLSLEPEQETPKKEPEESFVAPAKDQSKNKQILDALPTELINRIRQSSKRKPVPVIEPLVPKKKRQTLPVIKEPSVVQLDHDYCTSGTPRKDSGFSSCEEDERSILRSQPTVKNADGKLMVSLLKSNTIKKKLNLEEYKKRLQGKSQTNSGSNSPAPEEDENTRRLKHQEMLMKMAEEIVAQQQNKSGELVEVKKEDVESKPPADVPSNIIKKTLVSVGTNTEESWGHLEQILQSTRIKISPNSLISSIVEHLPKVKPVISKQVEHGEDKTIVYLDRNTEPPEMNSVHVQTVYSSTRRRRRRKSSSSTSSSRSSSSESCSSSTSRESSRSRTPSPVRRRQKEQLKEVEERRVIYVGRISEYVTREDLRRRFGKFGPITNVSVHFRRRADNYGFVTFLHKEDAYQAVEHGNDDPDEPQYDLSFGGRRIFCQTTYSDLDDVKDDAGYWSPITGSIINTQENTFDVLLREAQEKLKKRQL